MAEKIILKDWDGTDKVYEGIRTVTLPTEDGGTVQFSSQETVENAITQAIADVTAEDITVASDDVNFADGEMVISAPDGKMVQNVTVKSPANLLPENIAEGIDIAGVVGTLAGGGASNVLAKVFRGPTPGTDGYTTVFTAEELATIGFDPSKKCVASIHAMGEYNYTSGRPLITATIFSYLAATYSTRKYYSFFTYDTSYGPNYTGGSYSIKNTPSSGAYDPCLHYVDGELRIYQFEAMEYQFDFDYIAIVCMME